MFETVNKSEKVSDGIISQIRDAILSGELKPGDKLASEKELMVEFGVSKATMREALRVLEVMGLIEIRKGLGGGSFVAEVSMGTTIHGILNFLHFQSVSMKEITLLRYLLEPTVAQIAALKRTDEDIRKLGDIIGEGEPAEAGPKEIARGISFHRYLARITENPMLILVIDFVDGYLDTLKIKLHMGGDFYEHVKSTHQIILECLIQKDPLATAIAMTHDILEVDRLMSRQADSPAFDPAEIQFDRQLGELQFRLNPNALVVSEDDPALEAPGAVIRRVGKSRLFVVGSEYLGRA